jgi:hypothetical protein
MGWKEDAGQSILYPSPFVADTTRELYSTIIEPGMLVTCNSITLERLCNV